MTGRCGRELLFTGALLAFLAAYAVLSLALGGTDPRHFLQLLANYLRIAGSLWLLVGLVALLVVMYRNRPARGIAGPSPLQVLGRELHVRWARDRFMSFFAPPLVFALLVASFNLFKQTVLHRAGFGADPALAALDRALFGGVDPWRVTHALLSSPWATFVIDQAYHAWFLPMSIGVIICGFLPTASDHLRIRYLFSFVGVWVLLGSGLASLLPSAGPCFQPTPIGSVPGFEPMLARLSAQQDWIAARLPGAGLAALGNQMLLLDHFGSGELTIGGGISAMPSIHNALAVLFALAAGLINRTAGRVLAGYAVLIWVGSVHLGWHYAVDGPVAAALTYAIWRAAGRCADRLLCDRRVEAGRVLAA